MFKQIASLPHLSLDELTGKIIAAHARGELADAEAQALIEDINSRRRVARPIGRHVVAAVRRPRRPRSPDKQRSIARRRRWAASGWLPPALAALFTLGEQAVLAVVARRWLEVGFCDWCNDRIAAEAGVSVSTVKRTERAAEVDLIEREQRRLRADRNLPNKLTIKSREWKAWLERRKGGGGQKRSPSNTQGLTRGNRQLVGTSDERGLDPVDRRGVGQVQGQALRAERGGAGDRGRPAAGPQAAAAAERGGGRAG